MPEQYSPWGTKFTLGDNGFDTEQQIPAMPQPWELAGYSAQDIQQPVDNVPDMPKLYTNKDLTSQPGDTPKMPAPPPGTPGFENTARDKFLEMVRQSIADKSGIDPLSGSPIRQAEAYMNEGYQKSGMSDISSMNYDPTAMPNWRARDTEMGNLTQIQKQGKAQLQFMMDQFDKEVAANKPIPVAQGASLYLPDTKTLVTGQKKTPNEIELIQRAGQGDAEAALALETLQTRRLQGGRERTDAATERAKFADVLKSLPKQKSEAVAAQSRVTMYKNLSGMLDKGAGGLVPGLKGILAPVAEALGMDVKDMSEAQAFQLMARAGVGKMRLELVGSGQVSNFEQDLMQRLSGGSIKTSRTAAKKLFDYYAEESKAKVDNYNRTIENLAIELPDVARVYGKIGGNNPPPPRDKRPLSPAEAAAALKARGK
jgi:hypothetical protein